MTYLNVEPIKLKNIIVDKQDQQVLNNITKLLKKIIKNISPNKTSKIYKKIDNLTQQNININQQIYDIDIYEKKKHNIDDLKFKKIIEKKEHLIKIKMRNEQEILDLLKQLEPQNSRVIEDTSLTNYINQINEELGTAYNKETLKTTFIDNFKIIEQATHDITDINTQITTISDKITSITKRYDVKI